MSGGELRPYRVGPAFWVLQEKPDLPARCSDEELRVGAADVKPADLLRSGLRMGCSGMIRSNHVS
jgi:hypothetical protein